MSMFCGTIFISLIVLISIVCGCKHINLNGTIGIHQYGYKFKVSYPMDQCGYYKANGIGYSMEFKCEINGVNIVPYLYTYPNPNDYLYCNGNYIQRTECM